MEEHRYSQQIKKLRAYLGLSLSAFAKPLDLSSPYISQLENGFSASSENVINIICETYHVNPK